MRARATVQLVKAAELVGPQQDYCRRHFTHGLWTPIVDERYGGYINHPDSSLSLAFRLWIPSGLPGHSTPIQESGPQQPREVWKPLITADSLI